MGELYQSGLGAPTSGESIHPVIDTLEMRLRCELLREAQEANDPNTIVVKALEYAAEAEQRISSLSARVRTLESLANTDELSGLLNRRGFYDVVRRELHSAARYDETGVLISTLMISSRSTIPMVMRRATRYCAPSAVS